MPDDVTEDLALEIARVNGIDLEPEPVIEEDHHTGDPENDGEDTWTAEEMADVSMLDEDGYVLSHAPSWAEKNKKQIGRITDWPATLPYDRRNVSCSCFIHRNCKSPAKKPHQVDDKFLLGWLFSAVVEERPSSDRLVQLRAMHQESYTAAFLLRQAT